MTVCIVIPAYNEARRLPATLEGWQKYLGDKPYESVLTVVDDGSRHETSAIAEAVDTGVVRFTANRGKGAAVRAGVLAADADIVAYVDGDMNVSPNHLGQALELIRGGADVVVGQRNLSTYASYEGPVRLLAGGLVQLIRRMLVLRSIRDTQCGFKVFRADVAMRIFRQTRIDSFAFDIEVLFSLAAWVHGSSKCQSSRSTAPNPRSTSASTCHSF